MKSRFLYMKFLGLLLVITGFSYSLTSFVNFFDYIFETKIFIESINGYIASIGLIIPLSLFVYGVYFYFYTDFNITKISKLIFGFNIAYFMLGILIIIFKSIYFYQDNLTFLQVFSFLHISLGYVLTLLASMGLYGCFKYKF